MKEIQEDEVLFENTDEDPVTVATTLTTLSQATVDNVTLLNEMLSQPELENTKLKGEIINLKEEMNKSRKVESDMTSLKISIVEQLEQLHDVKMECFKEIQKMANNMKMVEKHLEILSQVNQRRRSLQAKIEDLDKWKNMEKNVPNNLPVIKSCDISLHTLATTECQDLASRFQENAIQNIAGMLDLYEKSIYDIERYI